LTHDEIRAAVMQHATEADALIGELGRRLGADYFTLGEDLLIERTAKGRATVRYGGVLFFADQETGEPVGCRIRQDGEPEFVDVTPDGLGEWRTVGEMVAAYASLN
jgi:hypothetical protein